MEAAHAIAEDYPQHVVAFGHAFRFFDREELLDEQDRTRKIETRRAAIDASTHGRTEFCARPRYYPFGQLPYAEHEGNAQKISSASLFHDPALCRDAS